MEDRIEGTIWKVNDDIDTDLIIGGEFLATTDETILAQNCFASLFPDFYKRVQPGDVIVAGKNFGCGSSREHAPIALLAAGVGGIVAQSFSRIFFRNAINLGLPVFENAELWERTEAGDRLSVDLRTGVVQLNSGFTTQCKPLPDFIQRILESGGLESYYATHRS